MVTTSTFLNQLSENPLPPVVLNQQKFDRGVVSVVDQSNLPKNALKEADNLTLVEDGVPTPREGVDLYGTAAHDGLGKQTLTSDATNVTDADTVTIASTVYRFKDTMAQAYDVKIGASAAATLDNIKAAINASGTAGVEYYTGTLIHPTVTATTNTNTTQIVAAKTVGTAGNSIATTEASTHLSWGAATLSGGHDGLDGGAMHVVSDETSHMLQIAGGIIYRSTNDGTTWTVCTGATLTAGKKCDTEQADDFTFIGNGEDAMVRYDGTTALTTYTALTTPIGNAPSKTGLASTTYTLRYRVSAYNDVGNTISSAAQTVQVSQLRPSFDATNYVTFTWATVTGAEGYNIYVGQTASEEGFIDSVVGEATTTYIDYGGAVEQTNIIAPDSDTTGGPKAGSLKMVGSRLYATIDKDFPFRWWISGAGRFVGQFGSTTEATYVDWQKGGQYRPVHVEDYRDGKGTPLATVWLRSKDGRGAIIQGNLESFTIGDTTFPVPNFNRLPGSRGTDAPFGVVNVLNDYMYPNSQAFYNLGSRAQFLNLLSTDEASVNIRPDVRSITAAHTNKIASYFSNISGKVYFSCPINGSTVNNITTLYDTERKSWMPRAFMIGFERFFDYTDNDSSEEHHMLCWGPGDVQFSEISTEIEGDYGEAFQTSLIGGLTHYNPKNRGEFMWADEAFIEVSNPKGTITVEFSAIVRDDGYKVVDTVDIEPDTTLRGWSTFAWSTTRWSSIPDELTIFAEPSTKRYFSVQEDINAYQFRISTEEVDADYQLRTLQVSGTGTEGGMDTSWEVFPT